VEREPAHAEHGADEGGKNEEVLPFDRHARSLFESGLGANASCPTVRGVRDSRAMGQP
jgi:hypothetical protein